LTEEQIIHTFSSVGQVLNFRLVYDNDTGRPKGFGFAEFADTDAAASAVRNLNNYEVMGRELRVDFSHVGGKDDTAPVGYNSAQLGQQPQAPQPSQVPQASNGYSQPASQPNLPPLPPGVDLPPGLTCPNAISQTLTTLPAPQLLDILSQMKGLVMADPAKATELLKQAPQLSYAIFQALLLMGLVDTTVLASVVDQASQPAQPPAPQPAAPPRPAPVYQPPPPAQPTYPQYPTAPVPMHAPIPPTQPLPYQTLPVQQAPPPQQPGQEELLKQVLAMPQQQIDLLPPTERSQIMMLRQQYMGRY
jgi:cleavage stimulation factor subunit 2